MSRRQTINGLLNRAIRCQNYEEIERLVQEGADINHRSRPTGGRPGGITPIHQAIFVKNPTVVHVLIRHGANLNERDGAQYCPLEKAIIIGSLAIFELLLKNGADPNSLNPDTLTTPLHLAAEYKRIQMVRLLVEMYKVDIHTTDKLNRTALGHTSTDTKVWQYLDRKGCPQ